MSEPFVVTYDDVLERLRLFVSARGQSVEQGALRYAAQSSLRQIVSTRDWQSLMRLWRVQLVATQTAGTVTYRASGGTYPRQLTLSGATWPSWAQDATIRIGDVLVDIDTVYSSTVATCREPRVPVADISTASAYTLGRGWYALDPKFIAMWDPSEASGLFCGQYIPFSEYAKLDLRHPYSGNVRYWTVGPAPNQLGTMALYVYPWSQTAESYDMVVKLRPRDMRVAGSEAWARQGTVSVASGEAAVTGTGTAFRSSMVGSIIRFSYDGTSLPTGIDGVNPYAEQRVIIAVDGTSALTLDGPVGQTFSGVKYVVSDPLDIDISMYDAYLRLAERNLASGAKDFAAIEKAYRDALFLAKTADGRTRAMAIAGEAVASEYRLSDSTDRPILEE
jgi:hypothetical protein